MSDKLETKKIAIYYACSLGRDCTGSEMLKKKKIKFESYPFDWLQSDSRVIIDCLETDFRYFLNHNKKKVKRHPYYKSICKMHYRMNESNYEYYYRCVQRFRNILKKDENKLFLVINRNTNYDYNQVKEDADKLKNCLKKYTKNFYIFYVNQTNIEEKPETESEPTKISMNWKTYNETDENIIYLHCTSSCIMETRNLAAQIMDEIDKYFEFKTNLFTILPS